MARIHLLRFFLRQPRHIRHRSDVTKLVGIGHSADRLDHAVGDVTAVVRYALGSAILVPAWRARVTPRNASCTMSSASPTDPVIP